MGSAWEPLPHSQRQGGDGGQRKPPLHQRIMVDLKEDQQVHPNTNPIELTDRLNLGKDKNVVIEKREDDYRKIKCFVSGARASSKGLHE
jgi:hypothetical protein